jgi:hypothetical protein
VTAPWTARVLTPEMFPAPFGHSLVSREVCLPVGVTGRQPRRRPRSGPRRPPARLRPETSADTAPACAASKRSLGAIGPRPDSASAVVRAVSPCSSSKKTWRAAAGGAGAASAPPAWANTPTPTIRPARTCAHSLPPTGGPATGRCTTPGVTTMTAARVPRGPVNRGDHRRFAARLSRATHERGRGSANQLTVIASCSSAATSRRTCCTTPRDTIAPTVNFG